MTQIKIWTSICAIVVASPALGQSAIDRVDPSRIERDNLPKPPKVKEPQPVVERAVPATVIPETIAVEVGAITFEGLRDLSERDFSDIFARYIGRSLSADELTRLTEEIGSRARGRGYVFASAAIAPQRLSAGVLRVQYDPGILEAVRIDGDENAAVRAALAPLIGRPARMDEVERRLLIAGDVSGVTILRSAFVREDGRGTLVVKTSETRTRVRAVFENDSTAPIGPEQFRIDADINGVLASDDAFTVTYVSTPFEPAELQYVRAGYSKRVSRDGTEVALAVAASSTHPGAYLDAFDISGDSLSATVSVLQPLHRRRTASLWLNGSVSLRDVEQFRAGERRRRDRILAVRVSVNWNMQAGGGLLRGSLTLSQGLDALGATAAGDALASRDDADGTFTTLLGWGDWTRGLGGGVSLRLAAQAQLSSRPLLVAEEIGIGGSAFLRGYDYSERSGDQGYMGLAEVRYDWRNPLGLGRKAQLYAFVDGGRVTNLAGGFGGGGLVSGGGGVRADVSPSIDANVELAVPLSGPRYETENKDPRLNLRVLKAF
ncbi:hypothetical protein ASE86_04445 [Sphingomonas sp. Leaf33]|uniref:ShlB/FhaC/HecB family hemolysin secretion/activation protein n=1 Tax=Sphingomonas sp. Leaf33 TaxID=1736215 RepID=UPI0006FD5323|nr:ShlB/FhaC/HecB family hemolysin secretion/activation protein [Sphingomonas sp. Leaf33]KQN25492.1 hypothetical protein ASE86_04445 [Sphingomonas sp. Leaf33]